MTWRSRFVRLTGNTCDCGIKAYSRPICFPGPTNWGVFNLLPSCLSQFLYPSPPNAVFFFLPLVLQTFVETYISKDLVVQDVLRALVQVMLKGPTHPDLRPAPDLFSRCVLKCADVLRQKADGTENSVTMDELCDLAWSLFLRSLQPSRTFPSQLLVVGCDAVIWTRI